MKTTGESETYCLSKIEITDLRYYLNMVKHSLLNLRKNNNSKEIRSVNTEIGLFNIDKAMEILQ